MLRRPVVALAALAHSAAAIRPKFSWDTLGNMTFIHTCNESGLFSDAALDTITKFPFVTVEKGQGFNDGTGRYAEEKIAEQLGAVKKRDPAISTVRCTPTPDPWPGPCPALSASHALHPSHTLHPLLPRQRPPASAALPRQPPLPAAPCPLSAFRTAGCRSFI